MQIVKTTTILIALSFSIFSCSKKADEQSTTSSSNQKTVSQKTLLSPVRDHSLLAYLPTGSIGFSLVDYTLPSSGRWLNSSWGKSQFSFSDLTKKLDDKDADVKKLLTILEGLEQEGLLPSEKAVGNLQQVLAFVTSEQSTDKKEHPVFVIIENFKSGIDGPALLSAAKAKIIAAGVEVKDVALEGGSAYSTELILFRPKDKTGPVVSSTMTFAAKGSRLVISSSAQLPVASYLADTAPTGAGIKELKSTPAFVKALDQVLDSSDEFSVSYVDTKKLLKSVSQVAPDSTVSADELNKVPVQSVVFIRSMGDALIDSGAVTLSEEAGQASPIAKELANVSGTSFFTQVPKGLVGLLSVDGALIKAVAQSALDSTPEKERQEAQVAIAPLMGAKEFGLVVRPQKGASPLPELAILLETADAVALTKTIATMIATGAGSQGFLPPFKTKDVNGVAVQYALSPFGAGIYIGNTDTHVLLTSAESLMTELIAIQKGGSGGVLDDYSKESKELLSNPQGVAAFQVNYASVAELIDGLSASLGIFTGGQPLMEAKELEALRSLGKTAVQLLFKNNAISFISRSESASK